MLASVQSLEQIAVYLALVFCTSTAKTVILIAALLVWRSTSAMASTSGTATGVARTWHMAKMAIEKTANLETFIFEGFLVKNSSSGKWSWLGSEKFDGGALWGGEREWEQRADERRERCKLDALYAHG
jgi:hypothetical protein